MLRSPVPVLAIVAGVVALLAIRELLKLCETYQIRPLILPTYIFCGLFFLLIAVRPGATDLLSTAGFAYFGISAAVLAPFIFLSIAMHRAELASGFPAAMLSAFSFVYVALPMASLVQLREQWRGGFFLLYLLLLVWAGDIFAYFIGKPFGRHRMSPRVSPKKTWSGAIGGTAAATLVGAGLSMLAGLDHVAGLALVCAALSLAAQAGDLLESALKRRFGAKNASELIPGHGGLMDRLDGFVAAAVVASLLGLMRGGFDAPARGLLIW